MVKGAAEFPGQVQTVELGERSYPIYVGSTLTDVFGDLYVNHCETRRAVIVTDSNVGPLYAERYQACLQKRHIPASVITISAGESSKCVSVVEDIYERLFDLAIERSDTIIALGGGVVGDLAGFAAATFKRGVNYIQCPTTLLAMVDSSIGGKTGINHPRGKNMIGAFYQPKLVFADVDVLNTLPDRELGCGLAETVKHGIIRDGEFFDRVSGQVDQIHSLEADTMVDLVVRNCRIKAAVVSADEKESGLRGILNLGHTIGHVFETVLYEYDFHHGEAVSLGTIAACRLAVQRGLLAKEDEQRIHDLLDRLGLPVSVRQHLQTHQDRVPPLQELPVDAMYNAMKQDKKVKEGRINFVLPTKIGDCTFVNDLTENEIKTYMQSLYD